MFCLKVSIFTKKSDFTSHSGDLDQCKLTHTPLKLLMSMKRHFKLSHSWLYSADLISQIYYQILIWLGKISQILI
jgi:hypothetical protein